MNGGYVIVDCMGTDLYTVGPEYTVPGIYDKLKVAMETNKPIFLTGIVDSSIGLAYTPIAAACSYSNTHGTDIEVAFLTAQLHVTSADVVTN